MIRRRMSRLLPLLVLPSLVLVAACERSSTELDDDHSEFFRVQVLDRGQTGQPVVATWVAGEGWTGSLPDVSLSSATGRIVLGFRVFDEDGDELALSEDDESIRYALAAGAPQGVQDLSIPAGDLFHGDHVYLHGLASGTTRVQFVLWHLDHADDATDPIELRVLD